jgi:type IV secretory pathway TrbF-like protein
MAGRIKRAFNKLFNRNKWQDADEYQRARWAYEGEGVASTKAAWILGAGFVAMTVFAGYVVHDRHELATLGDLKFVQMETNRTTGDVVSVSITDGKLMIDETKRRQFIRYWISLWRAVPTDPVVYNQNYLTAQVYMNDLVYERIDGHLNAYPVRQLIDGGFARIVRNVRVTPNGNGVRYRVDWNEALYRDSQLVSETQQTADLDLEQFTPRTDQEAEINMFGFIVNGFYWTPPPGLA